jgi:hypothetical protein
MVYSFAAIHVFVNNVQCTDLDELVSWGQVRFFRVFIPLCQQNEKIPVPLANQSNCNLNGNNLLCIQFPNEPTLISKE